MSNKKEIRSAALIASIEHTKQTIEGYATVFNSETLLYSMSGIDFYETVDAGAFEGTELSNVVLWYNHSDNFSILARTSNNTLRLSIDETGLKIEADIAETTQGKDIYELIKRKDISKMSYGYIVEKDYIEKVAERKYVRHISKIKKLIDVSVVDIPAYDGTNVDIMKRSFEFIEKEIALRKYIEIKSKIAQYI